MGKSLIASTPLHLNFDSMSIVTIKKCQSVYSIITSLHLFQLFWQYVYIVSPLLLSLKKDSSGIHSLFAIPTQKYTFSYFTISQKYQYTVNLCVIKAWHRDPAVLVPGKVQFFLIHKYFQSLACRIRHQISLCQVTGGAIKVKTNDMPSLKR